jgi:phosphoglycolate phosphatase-like HAD superfamily hydrolase
MRLALDFDGVFWDSVGECYVIAQRAWAELFGHQLPPCEAGFRAGRWLARVGSDFGVLLQLASEDPGADLHSFPRAEWELRQQVFPGKQFEETFYRLREQARRQDPAGWAALQGPYREFVAELPELKRVFGEPAIATTKDAESVHTLLRPLGLDLTVLGREVTTDKKLQIGRLCQEWGVQAAEIWFVDDLLDNLRPVQEIGARVALAAWGYNTPDERDTARREGIPLLRLGHVLEGLCG